MKHLCVINPVAFQASGHVEDIVDTIKDFFGKNPKLNYAIHVTRWKRDASGHVMRYVRNSSEMVRVYAFGGSGTLFEVVNGVMGLPNVEVAYFPLGREDSFLESLGTNTKDAFASMPNLLYAPALSVDTILAGNHFVLSGISIGIGTLAFRLGRNLAERFMLPLSASYAVAWFYCAFTKNTVQRYRIESDSVAVEDDFAGLFITNVPGNGGGFSSTEARLNDGFMDLYTVKRIPARTMLRVILDFQKGLYKKWPGYIGHYRCKKLKIRSLKDMAMILDGEIFYDTKLTLEVFPNSLNFVCPPGIDDSFFKPPKENPVSPDDVKLPEEIPVSDFFKSEGPP